MTFFIMTCRLFISTIFPYTTLFRSFKEDLYKYITGIVRNNGHKLISINGMPDHVHILIGLKPAMALADLVRDIKADSSKFGRESSRERGKFWWDEGSGTIS